MKEEVILKVGPNHPVGDGGLVQLNINRGAEVLDVQEQAGELQFWFRCDLHEPMETRSFHFLATGEHFEDCGHLYLRTVQFRGGRFVFHIFEVLGKRARVPRKSETADDVNTGDPDLDVRLKAMYREAEQSYQEGQAALEHEVARLRAEGCVCDGVVEFEPAGCPRHPSAKLLRAEQILRVAGYKILPPKSGGA